MKCLFTKAELSERFILNPELCKCGLKDIEYNYGGKMKPEELKYTKTHEWIKIDGDTAVIGVSDHAQHQMGDIVFVDLPKVGDRKEKGKQACVVESVKSAFDIYAPVSGEIIEVNSKLSDEPALVNQSPVENGWLFKMKISNPDTSDLMDWNAYSEFAKNEVH